MKRQARQHMCKATGRVTEEITASTSCLHEHDSSRLEEDTLGGLKALLVQFGGRQQDVSCLGCSHMKSKSGHGRPNPWPLGAHGSSQASLEQPDRKVVHPWQTGPRLAAAGRDILCCSCGYRGTPLAPWQGSARPCRCLPSARTVQVGDCCTHACVCIPSPLAVQVRAVLLTHTCRPLI